MYTFTIINRYINLNQYKSTNNRDELLVKLNRLLFVFVVKR